MRRILKVEQVRTALTVGNEGVPIFTHLKDTVADCVISKLVELLWMYGIGCFDIRGGCEGVRV